MATRYRDLQRPTILQTGLVDTSGVQKANDLARVFSDFSRRGESLVGDMRAQQGAQEGAAAGAAGRPEIRRGWQSLTRYGEAYNNAATRSYAIKLEADIEGDAARIETESANDPQRFAAVLGAVRDEALKQALPGTEQIVQDQYNLRIAAGTARLGVARAQEEHKANVDIANEGVLRAVDRIGRLRASLDPGDQELAVQEETKLEMLIDGAHADGTYTDVQAAVLRQEAMRGVTKATVLAKFQQEIENPYGNPIAFLTKFKEANKTSEALPPDEEQELEGLLLGELRDANALRSAAAQAEEDAQRQRQEEGNQRATSLLLGGQLRRSTLKQMIDDGDIDPDRALTLANALESSAAGGGESDGRELLHTRINLLSMTEDEILQNPHLSTKDKGDLILKRREESTGWKATQAAREGEDRIDRALGIPPGAMLALLPPDEAQKRDRARTDWYNQVEALPPDQREGSAIAVAEEVIQKTIKSSAQASLKRARERLAQFDAAFKQKYGDSPGKNAKAEYEKQRAIYVQAVANAEAKAQ